MQAKNGDGSGWSVDAARTTELETDEGRARMRVKRIDRDACKARALRPVVFVLAVAFSLSGCLGFNTKEIRRGYVVEPQSLAQVKEGMGAPQVLEILGNPSTTSTVGGSAWYYVSQVVDQTFAFTAPEITDQRVVAIYFDGSRKVTRKADYGLRDGKVFDFVSRTTPTGGNDGSFVRNLFGSIKLFNHE